jgi:F-type H+-transporting ATPase subunit delta
LSLQTIARRYAVALADVVSERGEANEVQRELAIWDTMLQTNEQLREVFRNPVVPYERKRKVLDELIRRSRPRTTTANFLQVLLQNQRLPDLGEVYQRFVQIIDERSGVVAAQVTTARPIADEAREDLRRRLEQVSGKKVRMSFATDPELIGGVVTRVGSTVYDGSVRNQLQQLHQHLVGK